MLREHVTLDYALQIVDILDRRPGPMPAGELAQELGGSASYLAKVCSRMSGAKLLVPGADGYTLARPVSALTLADVLRICGPAPAGKYTARLADRFIKLGAQVPLAELLRP